jgi:hypothetical protein
MPRRGARFLYSANENNWCAMLKNVLLLPRHCAEKFHTCNALTVLSLKKKITGINAEKGEKNLSLHFPLLFWRRFVTILSY